MYTLLNIMVDYQSQIKGLRHMQIVQLAEI